MSDPGSYYGSPPRYGGTGSGAGPVTSNPLINRSMGGWEPTVVNLLLLLALEIGGYMALRWVFRSAHGG